MGITEEIQRVEGRGRLVRIRAREDLPFEIKLIGFFGFVEICEDLPFEMKLIGFSGFVEICEDLPFEIKVIGFLGFMV